MTSVAKLLLRFSFTNSSDVVKKARMWEMKSHSLSVRGFQSVASSKRLISSAVQNEASAFLYIHQMPLCWMENRTKGWGFARRSGLGARSPFFQQSCALIMS